jgi:hypothetical protein
VILLTILSFYSQKYARSSIPVGVSVQRRALAHLPTTSHTQQISNSSESAFLLPCIAIQFFGMYETWSLPSATFIQQLCFTSKTVFVIFLLSSLDLGLSFQLEDSLHHYSNPTFALMPLGDLSA